MVDETQIREHKTQVGHIPMNKRSNWQHSLLRSFHQSHEPRDIHAILPLMLFSAGNSDLVNSLSLLSASIIFDWIRKTELAAPTGRKYLARRR
jgi:hypothetical protein